ncbi:unnamed protein product [Pleuronectes platessa]|uniref:Histone chaperone domain-containing protein n=1 Tax=Pleuronectes platessa TaxID=8262 RepID=A0A9N7YBT4_PLEPL|nr:unnamed protein product [Pleuronectes platessa]
MVSEKGTERIRRFVCDQLRDQPDLSTLTLGILKKRYLVLSGLESLSPEARNYMKQVVQEELLKMQEMEENEVKPETKKPHNKRKREKENDDDEVESGIEDEDESTAKKSRRQISSESEDNESHKTGSEGSAEEENKESGSEDAAQKPKKNGIRKRKKKVEESPVEDLSESGESDSEGPKDTRIKKNNRTKNKQGSSSTRPGKKTPHSDEENETDTERESETSDKINESSDDSDKKSEDNESHKTGSEGSAEEENKESGSEDAEPEVKKSEPRKNGNRKRKRKVEDSPVEDLKSEDNESHKTGSEGSAEEENKESGSEDAEPEVKKSEPRKNGNRKRKRKVEDLKENVPVKKENNQDSDSSSLTSLEDDQETGRKKKEEDKKKKKTVKKDEKNSGQKDDHKQVVRLKRYIALCGVKRNYKKLLDGCSSVRSMVAVLKKDLEDLGVQGQPSIKKCKRVKKKREDAQEIAELDISNIISTTGRPKRRGASLMPEGHDSPSSEYNRNLNSASDSDEENGTHKGHRRATDWTNLKGIISDDADNGPVPRANVSASTPAGMNDDAPDEVLDELRTRPIGGWGIAQIAAGTGLAVYTMWVVIVQPGFRKVPLRLQVPYIPASKAQVDNVMTLVRGRKGGLVDLGSGDGRIVLEAHRQGFTPAAFMKMYRIGGKISGRTQEAVSSHVRHTGSRCSGSKVPCSGALDRVDLTECMNITVFLAPSVLSLLQEKLQAELSDDALVVAGRFPFPDWKPCRIEGQGVDRAWAYSMKAQRQHALKNNDNLTVMDSDNVTN